MINDSCSVIVPIDYIRLANEKLIERKYLIKIIEQKDSILIQYDNYSKKQSLIIKNYQEDINKANKVNQDLQKKLNNQKVQTIVASSVGAGIIAASLITILVFTAN